MPTDTCPTCGSKEPRWDYVRVPKRGKPAETSGYVEPVPHNRTSEGWSQEVGDPCPDSFHIATLEARATPSEDAVEESLATLSAALSDYQNFAGIDGAESVGNAADALDTLTSTITALRRDKAAAEGVVEAARALDEWLGWEPASEESQIAKFEAERAFRAALAASFWLEHSPFAARIMRLADSEVVTLTNRLERMEGVVEAARHVAIHGGVHEMGDFEGTDFGTAHGSLCDALANLDATEAAS